ncbi:MAG: restriction endonuclease, partial [Nitrosomonadales bacterium]|nr:restriction endonuclease [Nitrosomonadales bacterium]
MKLTARQIVPLLFVLASGQAFAGDSSGGSTLLGWILFIAVIAYVVSQMRAGFNEEEAAVKENEKNAEFAVSAEKRITEIITKHLPTLAIKHQQAITQDSYGVVDVSGWDKEIDYFIDKVLWPEVGAYLGGTDLGRSLDAILAELDKINAPNAGKTPQATIDKLNAEIDLIKRKNTERISETAILINNLVTKYRISEIENATTAIDVDKLDPIQFEHYCAEVLRGHGWTARVTQASGDQGIDVIAQLGNVKAVLQCKKYSQPVGNAAVQEIFAGKQHEQAHVAVVVSN